MRFLLFLLILCTGAGAARADQRAVYRQQSDGSALIIEVADNGDARLQFSNQNWHLLVHGGEAYTIYDLPAGPMSARIADLEQLIRERDPDLRNAVPHPHADQNLVEHGAATYAGHSGTAYYLQTPYGLGNRPMLVISHDPTLRRLGPPLSRQLDFGVVTAQLGHAQVSPLVLQTRDLLLSGAALYFGGYALERIESARLDPGRFTLPTAPVSMDSLRNGSALPH